MSYVYNPGDPVTVLNPSEPANTEIVGDSADEAIRQIKAYLKDPTVGPASVLSALRIRLDAVKESFISLPGMPAGFVYYNTSGLPIANSLLLGNPSNVSRSTYSTFFALVGETFGAGDGVSTFTLPDMRGVVIAATDPTAIVITFSALYTFVGASTHTITEAETASHSHFNNVTYNFACWLAGGTSKISGSSGYIRLDTVSHTVAKNSIGDQPHQNYMPTTTVNIYTKL